MKPGTYIRLPDGREGTVVYSGLDGYGIKWGRIRIDLKAIESYCPIFAEQGKDAGADYPFYPDAMLRNPYPSATTECVGEEYERDDRDMPFSGSMEEKD